MSVPNLDKNLREAAASSDPEASARAMLQAAGDRLAVALAPVVGALDLSEVVLSGPAQLLDGVLLDAARRTLLSRLLRQEPAPVSVRLAVDAHDIVLRGASALVLGNQLGVA